MLKPTKITVKPILLNPLIIRISSLQFNDIHIAPSVNTLEQNNQQKINISKIYWSFIKVRILSYAFTDI